MMDGWLFIINWDFYNAELLLEAVQSQSPSLYLSKLSGTLSLGVTKRLILTYWRMNGSDMAFPYRFFSNQVRVGF